MEPKSNAFPALLLFVSMLIFQISCSGHSGCNLEITTQDLPDGRVGVEYSTVFGSHCGGNIWSIDSGALPPGLTLHDNGRLDGIPTEAGTFNFNVNVFKNASIGDSAESVSKGFSLTILN